MKDRIPVNTTVPLEILDRRIEQAHKRREWIILAMKLAVTLVVVYLLVGMLFGVAVVQGNSMYPNFKTGDMVLFSRLYRECEVGDVILFREDDGRELIKRVVAVAGDEVDIDDESGTLYVNGVPQEDLPVFYATVTHDSDVSFPLVVGENEVFVLGDNRTISRDSRDIGTISCDKITGKAFWCGGSVL
jgi:signal peptidase I